MNYEIYVSRNAWDMNKLKAGVHHHKAAKDGSQEFLGWTDGKHSWTALINFEKWKYGLGGIKYFKTFVFRNSTHSLMTDYTADCIKILNALRQYHDVAVSCGKVMYILHPIPENNNFLNNQVLLSGCNMLRYIKKDLNTLEIIISELVEPLYDEGNQWVQHYKNKDKPINYIIY